MKQTAADERHRFLTGIFPGGVPRLWCPPLTHYDRDGAIDGLRMAAHLRHLSAYVGGFLIPGSTGDGWELTPPERRQVLSLGLEQAQRLQVQVLIGALHPNPQSTLNLIRDDLEWLSSRFKAGTTGNALSAARVCGFTICTPRGKELTQEQIDSALSSILELGQPTAIYQLPQVTLNEIGPELAAQLAARFPNFVFFKDTSGLDAVVLSGKDLAGVFTARGAEGQYARWLKSAGGAYDGFLLASANCLARELYQVIEDVSAGQLERARALSLRLTGAVEEILHTAGAVPDGNAFTNANKAMDHFFAYGPGAATAPSPRLHAGSCLPEQFIRLTGDILSRENLMPAKGYLE